MDEYHTKGKKVVILVSGLDKLSYSGEEKKVQVQMQSLYIEITCYSLCLLLMYNVLVLSIAG